MGLDVTSGGTAFHSSHSKKLLRGILYIISAPSGAGKTTLVKALVKEMPGLIVSVSHTTRAMRLGEEEGVNYHFVTNEAFDVLVEQGAFLEHATVFGYSYGTTFQWVEQQLETGKDVVLEIDWQGALQVKQQCPSAVSIFILPPSIESLRERLLKRAQDSEVVIQKRLKEAGKEIAYHVAFDYMVVNDHFDRALTDLKTIVYAHRLKCSRQEIVLAELLQALLSGVGKDMV